MKKSIKSVLAKSMAVVMAFSLAGIAPNTSSEAAAKKPTLTKKVTVTVTFFEPDFTVIFAFPGFLAFSLPLEVTDTIFEFELV